MEKLKNFPRIFIIVILLLVFSTLAAWSIAKSTVERETTRLFNDEVDLIESWITNRFELYKTIAYGLQAFLTGNERVTEKEWQTYLETLKIKERFPGITAVNFAKRVDNNDIITFVYPPEREAVVGGNVITQPRSLEAMNKAIDSASLVITDKIFLLSDQSPGFGMYTPVYKTGFPINTVEEKRAAIEGLVAIIFRSEEVFKDLFDAHDTFPHLDFELYKGNILEEDHILYDHDYSHYISKIEAKDRLETKRTIISDGETFTLLVSSKPTFGLKTLEEKLPNLVLIVGLVFDFLIFLFALRGYQRLQKKFASLRPH